ncbi:MAG TPA: Ig-like domain-containing protein [Candidatus Eisenbacteria bacterium]|nr:Ig-like domain-containing protein [Candidatus Eisenbacteria bacterium]
MGLVLLAIAGKISAQTVINDGTATEGLIPFSNTNGTASAAASLDLNLDNGTLLAAQINETGFFPFRTVWHPGLHLDTNEYSVLADFKAADASDANRGGVMGWLDDFVGKGIAFQIVPNPTSDDPESSLLQVNVVDFFAFDAETNESVTNLFNLDGTPAVDADGSASAHLSFNANTNSATLRLDFVPPTAADRAALSDVTARVIAKMFSAGGSNPPPQVGPSIELLTNLPLPPATNHTFGYYAYWGSIFGSGTIGELDNLAVVAYFPPTVTLTSPTNEASFTAPADVTLSAVPQPVGSIQRVDFLANGQVVGSATSSPHTINWTNVAAGNYSLVAVATDIAGAAATSAPVAITIDAPTLVALTSPTNGSAFAVGSTVNLAATAGPAGAIQQVEFFANDQSLGFVTNSPYTLSWNEVVAGQYTLTAQATDGSGLIATSAPVNITVSAGPTIAITNPPAGANFTAPANITVTASADPAASIRRVDFFSNNQKVGTATNSPYSITWNNVAAGTYSLTAQATDTNGLVATSAPVAITVSGQTGGGPTLTIVSSGNQMVISWPASFTGFTLQSSADLVTWTNIPSTNNSATVPVTRTGEFFRLMQSGQPMMSPPLSIVSSNNAVIVSWPSTYTGFTLQANSDLGAGNWATVPSPGNSATIPATGPVKLFRLFKQ